MMKYRTVGIIKDSKDDRATEKPSVSSVSPFKVLSFTRSLLFFQTHRYFCFPDTLCIHCRTSSVPDSNRKQECTKSHPTKSIVAFVIADLGSISVIF